VTAEASMRIRPTVAMSMKMSAPDKGANGSVEIRFVDKAMYLGGNPEMAKEMDGKSWLKIDTASLGGGAADNNTFGVLPRQAEGNPAAQSTILTGAKDLKKVGTETVDGTRTTHYKGTVTGKELRTARDEAEGKATRERLTRSYDQFMALGMEKVTMDVWIDDEEHTKQFRMRGDARKGPLDMTITFLDINEPVKVTAPPAKDTADVAEMLKDAQS
jgi:uncharacterized protein YbjQ (UPF0145 family)